MKGKKLDIETDTDTGRTPCKDESRDGVMHLQIKERQRLPANYQKLEKEHGRDSPTQPSEGTNPADISISDFWPREL